MSNRISSTRSSAARILQRGEKRNIYRVSDDDAWLCIGPNIRFAMPRKRFPLCSPIALSESCVTRFTPQRNNFDYTRHSARVHTKRAGQLVLRAAWKFRHGWITANWKYWRGEKKLINIARSRFILPGFSSYFFFFLSRGYDVFRVLFFKGDRTVSWCVCVLVE